jgi:SAM-dependent methyltransferase
MSVFPSDALSGVDERARNFSSMSLRKVKMMNDTELARFNESKWDEWAASLDGKGWKYDYLRNAQTAVISMLALEGNASLLDIGCGTGFAIRQALLLSRGRGLYYGVDLSAKMIEKAKENFRGIDNCHFIKANAESIPLEDDSFDIVVCTNSFHHYPHPDKALREMRRLLKPEGRVYILDPTADHAIIKLADRVARLLEPGHVKLYGTREFASLITDSGLAYLGSQRIKMHQKVHIGQKQAKHS